MRDELFEAVHSEEYSTNTAGDIQRIPFSIFVHRMYKTRNEKAIALQDKLTKAEAATQKVQV